VQENTEVLTNAIFDNVDHLLIATDTSGVITKLNKAAERFLGYEAEEVVGLLTPALFHLGSEVVERAALFSTQLQRTIEPGFEVFVAKTDMGLANEHEWTYVTKSGKHKPVLLSVTALREKTGTITGYIGVAKDISESKRVAQDLRSSQNRLNEAQRIANIGSWSLDHKTGALLWSDQIYSIFEIDPLRFSPSYEGFLNSIHPDDVEKVNTAFHNALENKTAYNIEHRLLMKDGRVTYVIERGETLYSENGEALLTQGTVQDITELKIVQKSLIKAKENAENANKSKSRFLANMSHEIRTPLNGIMGFIELLQKHESDPKKRDYLDIIQTSSKSLLVVINDILDLSKIEDGNMKIEAIDFNLEQHLHELFSFFKSIAETNKITLNFEYPSEVSSHVHTDPLRLKQVLSNLISNAIKFSGENSAITITLHRNNEILYMSIKDEGIGISEEAQQRIFNPFEQAEVSTTRNYGGTGLGLSISKKLIELLGGEIQVESKLTEGSTFSFSLIAPEVSVQQQPSDPNDTPVLKGHVLVAEDNKTNQLLISILLDELNLTYTLVEDGKEAFDAFKTYPDYDLILMDINMPNMNGMEATQLIRQSGEPRQDIPIIALTANVIKEDVDEYLRSGMNAHISKPIDSDIFGKMLAGFLR
jgi:PAS domain S-box-containing protein